MRRQNNRSRLILTIAFAITLYFNSSLILAQGNGGDPTPPPITYGIRSYGMPVAYSGLSANAMNNLGQIVGRYTDAATGDVHGFLYNPLVNELQAFDLNNLVTVPAGWRVDEAYDINDLGQIVGNLFEINGTKVVPYMIDLYQPTGPELIVLPDLGLANLRGRKINNDGDVIVAYDATGGTGGTQPSDMYHFNPGIEFLSSNDDFFLELPFRRNGTFDLSSSVGNSPGKITGKLDTGEPFRYTLGDVNPAIPSELSSANVMSRINDLGVVVGSIIVPIRRNKTITKAFRYDERNSEPLETFEISSTRPQALNNDGDFTISSASQLYFYHEGSGFFDLNDGSNLEGDPQLISDWNNKSSVFIKDLSLRGASIWPTEAEFPTMCGEINFGASAIPIVLIPFSTEEIPGVTVTPVNGLVTTETGGTDTFDVVLDSEPTHDVTIAVRSDNTNEGTVDKSILTFTPANWKTAQTVTVTGVDDEPVNETGDDQFTIVITAAESADPDYDGLDPDDVLVTNLDNDGQPGGSQTYSNNNSETIPDKGQGVALSMINVPDPIEIESLTVTLDISHPRPSDLVAELTRYGVTVELTNLSGDNTVTGFDETSATGEWFLTVTDNRKKKTGTVNSWSITVDY